MIDKKNDIIISVDEDKRHIKICEGSNTTLLSTRELAVFDWSKILHSHLIVDNMVCLFSLIDSYVDVHALFPNVDDISIMEQVLAIPFDTYDTSSLYEKYVKYKQMMEGNNPFGANLYNGYSIFLKHHYCGYKLQKNGMFWNESRATEIENWCNGFLHNCLQNLMLSPLTADFCLSSLNIELCDFLVDNYLMDILGSDYAPKKRHKESVEVVALTDRAREQMEQLNIVPKALKSGAKIYKISLEKFGDIAENFVANNTQLVRDWYANIKNSYLEDDERILRMFNPNSTSKEFRDKISNILISDKIKRAKLMFDLFGLSESISEDYTEQEIQYLNKLNKLYHKDCSLAAKYKIFNSLAHCEITNSRIKRAFAEAHYYKLSSLDSLGELYDYFVAVGNDIENPQTWSEEFNWFVNFRLYKKIYKMSSTYINGSTGRRCVYTNSGGQTIAQTKFEINGTVTGRWKSGFHNIPAGDCIKSIYSSRFRGGCMAMPDGSQMEVRTLATLADDKNLQEAFANGKDIYRFVASKVFDIDYDNVSDTERNLCKSATLGIIYGMSTFSFAKAYTNGDVHKAQYVFDTLFSKFPNIQTFISSAHSQYDKFKCVYTKNGRIIPIIAQKQSDAYRMAQNYCVQSVAADIAGMIMWYIQDYIDTHHLHSKIILNIHDSIEIDMHPAEVFELIDVINYAFNIYPLKTFGVPIACDIPIGLNLGNEIKIVNNKIIHNDDYSENEFELEGYIDEIDALINNWKNVYSVVKVENVPGDEKKVSGLEDMLKSAKSKMTMNIHNERCFGKRKVYIKV